MEDVTIDLREDWKAIVIAELQKSGYTADIGEDVSELTFQFYNVLKRSIGVKPRTVFEAKSFNCPAEYSTNLAAFRSKIEVGDDVNPHLSTNLKRLDYNDGMLNDWGIYHFHLGQNLRPDSFVDRTGPLLFALVTDTSVFFIGIYSHGDWSDKAIFEVIRENWPELLDKYKLSRVVELEYNFNSNELAQLRRAGATTLVQTQDGTVFAPPGGGLVTTGQSLEVRGRAYDVLRLLTKLENWVKENTGLLIQIAEDENIKMEYPLNFSLLIEGDKVGVLENSCRTFFTLHDLSSGV